MNVLILFAKYPEPGRVKTRLAEVIGPNEARHFYRRMLKKVTAQTSSLDGDYLTFLYYDPPEREQEFKKEFPEIQATLSEISKRIADKYRSSGLSPRIKKWLKRYFEWRFG